MEDIILRRLSIFVDEFTGKAREVNESYRIINDENVEQAKAMSSNLSKILQGFEQTLHNYFNVVKEPNADVISEYTTKELAAQQTLVELQTKLQTKCNTQTTRTANENEATGVVTSKLPKLNLPEFGGDILEWHQFWDQFQCNIDQRNLSEVDKLLYLKSSLTGQAKKTIEGLSTTNRNYQIAVTTLKERYGKDIHVIDAHYTALNKIATANGVKDCRDTLNEIERHLRVLDSLGESINNNQLRVLIMEKFPEEIIYEMKMKMETETIEEMRKRLKVIITVIEESKHHNTQLKLKADGSRETTRYTTETLHVNEHRGKKKFSNKRKNIDSIELRESKKRKLSCLFCKGPHFNDGCKQVEGIEDRKKLLSGRCYICLMKGHFVNECRNRKRICQHCKRTGHNRAICPKMEGVDKKPIKTLHVNANGSTILQTAVGSVKGSNGKEIKCRMIMDSRSQRSYITQQVAKSLKLKVEEENQLSVFTFGAKTPKEINSPLVKIKIKTKGGQDKTLFVNVVPIISQGIPYTKFKDWNENQKGLLSDDGSLEDRVDILIGNDYYYSFMSTKKIQIGENLFLIESELGWIVSGKLNDKHLNQPTVLTYFQSTCDIGLNQPDLPLDNGSLKVLWDLESIGIVDSPKSNRDEEAIKQFNENTTFEEGRYNVKWPWNEYPPNLPTNFGLAFGRLVSLLKRTDKETLLSYDRTLKEQMDQGIIEIVPSKDHKDHPIHYLPHHGVSTPGKPVRIVYDASAKIKDNKSLNQCLYCGPMMLEDLTGLLLKFRSYPIGISADVEKAFLQIALHKSDRDVTRFLWLKDTSKEATKNNLLQLRFTRVPFGIISSPFILNATIKHHLTKEKGIVKRLANNIYVDNLVTGVRTPKEALELYKESRKAFNKISMNLREWYSNSEEFMNNIPEERKKAVLKILGMDWNLKEDTIQLRVKDVNSADTKRGILKHVASIYDPCGYTVPLVLPAKLLLQDLWKLKIKWDAKPPQQVIDKWRNIKDELNEIKRICIPRYYAKEAQEQDCQIHCFTDASTKAYAAVVYIVVGKENSFVIGKSKLVPIKDQDDLKIPRLELLGVLIGSRLIQYVLKFIQVRITEQILWTDSQIVIDWCNSDKLLAPFVQRRIEEIRKNKCLVIRHVPSELNPADVATRRLDISNDIHKWLNGPAFLVQERSSWPNGSSTELSLFCRERLLHRAEEGPNKGTKRISKGIKELEVKGSSDEPVNNKVEEIKKLQFEHFSEEVEGLETNLSRNLNLFKDVDGILRCKGRLRNADWPFDKRYPILIPKECKFTNEVIKETHERNYHVGVNHTLSIMRQSYWIPQGKSQVQKVIRKCQRCNKHGGGPFKLPQTPALPAERVRYSTPFTFTGIDYLGPVLVKDGSNISKRWICLFTCLAVRAIHLEVVRDSSAEEGLLAIRRMVATRGIPKLITSDNAMYFKLISEILETKYCVENDIKWKFIPELAPWFGGFYERLVGMVKHCMKRTLGKHLMGDNQLVTIVKEIEAVLNTRPLTTVDSELEHVLKPSDFLSLNECITMETSGNEHLVQGTVTKLDLVRGWKKSRIILEEFKEMFNNRYLPTLRERYWNASKQPRVISKEKPYEGQIVQIKGDKNRETWKVGKIVSLEKGNDGLCRVARVKVGKTILTRSLAHLYPLEIEEESEIDLNSTTERYTASVVAKDVNNERVQRMKLTPYIQVDKIKDEQIEENPIVNEERVCDEDVDDEMQLVKDRDPKINEDEVTIKKEDSERTDETEVRPKENKQKRRAAVNALKKIREWTSNLMGVFPEAFCRRECRDVQSRNTGILMDQPV